MTVGRICSRSVDVAEAGESVRVIAQRMLQRNVGTLLVPDEDGKPVGIVTDRDVVLRAVAVGMDVDEATVRQVMTEHPRRIREDMSIEAALSVMQSGSVRRLPVVNKSGVLVGLISLDDILMAFADKASMISRILVVESPRVLDQV